MSENPAVVEKRTCRFPGCQRPPEAPEASTGRPPEYCDDPTHNRASAWRARQQTSDAATRAAETRPVDSARQRASEITGQVSGMIEHLGQQLTALVEELRTVGDPEAAEAQIESVSSEAAEQVAAANVRATRAEQAQRRAEAQKDEADAAAEEETRASKESSQELAGVREELAAANAKAEQLVVELSEAQAETAALKADLESVRAQLDRAERDRDTAAARAEAAESARGAAEQRATGAQQRAELEAARADREETAAEAARAQLESLRGDYDTAREAAGELRSRVATVAAERDAARADVDREREHGEQRVKDLHETYVRQIDQLRDDLAQAREKPAQEGPIVKSQKADKD